MKNITYLSLPISLLIFSSISPSMNQGGSSSLKFASKNDKIITTAKIDGSISISEALKRSGIKVHASDSVIYNEDKHILKLYGTASFTNKKIVVTADFIEYNTELKKGEAIGGVEISDPKHKIKTGATHAYFNSK